MDKQTLQDLTSFIDENKNDTKSYVLVMMDFDSGFLHTSMGKLSLNNLCFVSKALDMYISKRMALLGDSSE